MERPANANPTKTITAFLKAPFKDGSTVRPYETSELLQFLKSLTPEEKNAYAEQAAENLGRWELN